MNGRNNGNMKLDDFLKFEKEHDLLKYKFSNSGYCMWPYIRHQVVSYLVFGNNSSLRPGDTILSKEESKYKIIISLVVEYAKSLVPCKKHGTIKNSKALFIVGDISDIKSEDGWYNRTLDCFAECFPNDSQMLILSTNTLRTPRRFKNYFIDVRLYTNIKIIERFNHINSKDISQVDSLLSEVENQFPCISSYLEDRIKKMLMRKCRSIDYEIKHFSKLVDRIKPKVAVIEDGCYGYDKAVYIKILKNKGIKVFEAQHGLIGLNHPAYNFIFDRKSEYVDYLPDVFMSYGKYWESVSRLPIRAIPVGNPIFYSNLVDGKEKKGRILIALTDYSSYWIDFVKDYLRDKIEVDIVIKAHPLSTNLLDDFREFEDVEGIELCARGNIYDFISEAEFIMSDMSTVIFEAYCKKKKVFVYDCEQSNDFIPKEIGFRIKSYSDFKGIVDILDNSNYLFADNVDYYFNSNWRDNYTKIFTSDDSV